jgi:molecular chaperone Hsp33
MWRQIIVPPKKSGVTCNACANTQTHFDWVMEALFMNADYCQRFMFERFAIRGALTQLRHSHQAVLSQHPYPDPVVNLLGEFMAAISVLGDALKAPGLMSLQARGSGQVRTVVAEFEYPARLRAIARYHDDFIDSGPLLDSGHLALTLEPQGGQRYQGIVALEAQALAQALEEYFAQSEQIKTRLWLAADDKRAAALLIQELPESERDPEDWQRIEMLAATVTDDELLRVPSEQLLHRLFHEEDVRVWPAKAREFSCTCSRKRSMEAIRTLGQDDALALVDELGAIIIDCQFCHAKYAFEAPAVQAVFAASQGDPGHD